MKEFNLELAKQGHPVCTRDGRPARVICWDKKNKIPNAYCILALIDINGDEIIASYTNEGRLDIEDETKSDLMMVTNKHEGWVNIYRDGSWFGTSVKVYQTKEGAIKEAVNDKTYIGTTKIEWEE